MSRPTVDTVHVDQVLSNISIRYTNGMYIADKICPIVPVLKKSDKYYIFDKKYDFTDTARYRAPGASSNRNGFKVSTDSYYCDEVTDATLLEDEVRDNADSVLNIEMAKTRFVTNKVLLSIERAASSIYTTTGNWSNSATPTNLWDDYDNSDPITDLQTAIDTVEDTTGQLVNRIVISKNVWKYLKHHPQILARLSNDTKKIATINDLKDLLQTAPEANLQILIGSARYNSANEGQTASYANIWDKDVWVGIVSEQPALETASAAYVFCWKRNGQLRGIRRWRDENVHSDVIEAFMSYDIKIVSADLGYVIEGAIS